MKIPNNKKDCENALSYNRIWFKENILKWEKMRPNDRIPDSSSAVTNNFNKIVPKKIFFLSCH